MTVPLGASDRLFVDHAVARLAEEARLVGGLAAAIGFKRSVVERLGLQLAHQVCRERLGVPGVDELRRREVVGLRSVAERAARFVELWPRGTPFVHPAPPVVGEGDHSEEHGVRRSAYLARLDDALVRGRSAVVLVADVAAVDFEQDELRSFEDCPQFDPAVLHAADGFYWTMEPAPPPKELDEAFLLVGSYAHDFGHWLTEHLPKLAIARMAGLPDVPILVDERMPPTHRQSLELFCPGSPVIVLDHLAPCLVRRLWCASSPTYRGFSPANWSAAWQAMLPDPESLAHAIGTLKALAASALDPPTGRDRVFLARRPERKKRLVNHQRIEQIAAGHGFAIVYPEDLDFVEQLRLVHHARHLVAPDGSNGLLCYFVSAGASVCFLNHVHTRPLVELNGLLRALGASFTIVTGPMVGEPVEEPFWSDYRIDEAAFDEFLGTWLHPERPTAADGRSLPPRPVDAVRVDELATVAALSIARERGRRFHTVELGAGTPPLEITTLDDVLYVPSALEAGQSLQIVEGRYLPFEAVFDDFTAEFVRDRLSEKDVRELTGFAPSRHPGDVCILGNVFSRNFTHWHEELMKVVAIERAELDCLYVVAELPAFAVELLRIIGVPRERVLEVHEPTRFRRALYGTAVSYRNVADYPAVLMSLRELLLASCGAAPAVGSRVWLDRGLQTRLGRRLVNEEEVNELLDRYGFERLDLGTLPPADQIAVARRLRVVAGLHGSQFVHTQLMKERSSVIECFSPLYLNPTYTEIYRVLRHRYAQLCGTNTPSFPYPHGTDVWVDCQQLDLALRSATDGERP